MGRDIKAFDYIFKVQVQVLNPERSEPADLIL